MNFLDDEIVTLDTEQIVNVLKAAGESTRLRLLLLLSEGELNVKDLTKILGQSQPRISRHLKLMSEAGLVERFREGSWVYFRLIEDEAVSDIIQVLFKTLDYKDPTLIRDSARARSVKLERMESAQAYFREHAAEWDKIRSLHQSEESVEARIEEILAEETFDTLVDLGTGTGRILEFFSKKIRRGIGIDINPDMLAYARSNIEEKGLHHCQVRYGDLSALPIDDDYADIVCLHQVLHFIDDPIVAIEEAARILKANGRLLVVDFAPHELEFLRDEFAHIRLGFSNDYLKNCFANCQLSLNEYVNLKSNNQSESDGLTVSIWIAEKQSNGKNTEINEKYISVPLENITS